MAMRLKPTRIKLFNHIYNRLLTYIYYRKRLCKAQDESLISPYLIKTYALDII